MKLSKRTIFSPNNSKTASWHNFGKDDDFFPISGPPPLTDEQIKDDQLVREKLKKLDQDFADKLDNEKSLSKAHQERTKNFPYDQTPDATPICSNGWATIYAKYFDDDSVLIFVFGEQGLEQTQAFSSLPLAKDFFNSLDDFEPL